MGRGGGRKRVDARKRKVVITMIGEVKNWGHIGKDFQGMCRPIVSSDDTPQA